MRKSVDKKTGITTYHYKVNKNDSPRQRLVNEIEKCKKGIKKIEELLEYRKWRYEDAKRDYESHRDKRQDLIDFMRLLEKDLRQLDEEERKAREYGTTDNSEDSE